MKYTKPEMEIMEIEVIDVIQTSPGGTEEGIKPGDNGTPGVGFGSEIPTI